MLHRGRKCRNMSLTDYLLMAIFLSLAAIFLVRRGYLGNVETSAQKRSDVTTNEKHPHAAAANRAKLRRQKSSTDDASQTLIDARIKKIPDARSIDCKSKEYKDQGKVSIIVDFFDYSFFDLKPTLSSILLHTHAHAIEEIIVVDDGSTLDYIVQDSQKYIDMIEKCRIKKLENHEGTTNARLAGAEEAKGDFLVFLDTSVIVNQGWLEPLVSQLTAEKSTIAVPHLDSINNPVTYEYYRSDDSYVSSMSWSLSMRMSKSTETIDDAARLRTPTTRGNILAITKAYYEQLKGFDGQFASPGGENLEMSLRTWLCGGAIYTLVCSRVGILNFNDPVKVTNHASIRRIVNLWASDKKKTVFKHTGIGEEMAELEVISLRERKAQLKDLVCDKDIGWYIKNVALNIATPSEKAVQFGMLKIGTGRCTKLAEDGRLELLPCKPEHFSKPPPEMLFELDEDGYLMVHGSCMTTKNSAYVVAEECRRGDSQQMWSYTKQNLINEWCKYCLMHVTDPDKKKKRQIAMAQECASSQSPLFIEFEFIRL